ncbi:receptor expression-enhancing protein 1-like isoform X2 [Actinia tenebrosa]|uniref:Receptor expression-enhancing protein n=1 Tax=Actinia tenebrosa TaxID=6105 RepID=A0A6P8I5G2_ACTTE|nr:receptor expression-enhancing protein 1-like isoform X2 [Actinia tenebrosa]
MVSYIASRIIMLVFGTLYPAYSSYKAIKTRNTREYVRWMMYWIVFALFTTAELFADLLLGVWFPFYYEIKIVFMIWLLSPTTKGSTILYRKFVHPLLSKHENEIDTYIAQAKDSGYETLVRVSRNSINIAAETMIKTAVTGQNVIAEKLRQYGSDQVEGDERHKMRKAKSWYGGMDSVQNDYEPINETDIEEEEEEEEEEEMYNTDSVEVERADAESAKLRKDLLEKKNKNKNYSSATLPRSFSRSSTYSSLYRDYNEELLPSSTYTTPGQGYEPSTGYSTRSRKKIA